MMRCPPSPVRRRTGQWFFILLLGFGLIGLRFVYLQVVRHAFFVDLAEQLHHRNVVIPATRGQILDRNGTVLAMSSTGRSLFLDPSLIAPHQRATVAGQVAPLLGMSVARVRALLDRPGRFVWLQRQAEDDVADRVLALKIRGIGAQTEARRIYPMGDLAAQTLGFINGEHVGSAGMELVHDRVLRGTPGHRFVEIDRRGRPIPGSRREETPAVDGGQVVLTIDARIQSIAEAQLARAVKEHRARGGTAVVMDPVSGDILALANLPSFDPNHYTRSSPERWANPAVSHTYEPGSTYKLITAAAALEEGIMGPTETAYCPGTLAVGKRVIHCAHGQAHGRVHLEKIIEKSCNVGAATVGLRLGRQNLARYVRLFGFGSRYGVGLPGEATGMIGNPATWSEIRLANAAFGQGISVTPLQLAAAYCAVANGGVLPRPHLIRTVVSPGAPPETPAYPGNRIISEQTAATLRKMLQQVVESGTGTGVQIEQYTVAGKTGTAQKALPGVGYASGRYIGSFIGFVPVENPAIVILVVIDEPRNGYYGGVCAGPAFKEIAQQSLVYLGVPPQTVARAH